MNCLVGKVLHCQEVSRVNLGDTVVIIVEQGAGMKVMIVPAKG